ncbi:putative bifunctional diguanylate cyclase/phosphodiesterase [Motiliproteus sediminis]|uniref:putative bifunctional diguanylate cyclase/phosphodiesterase n=1 Tax=Motiliproteus sediminis TaxID=1468178 RepID=UPI001AEF5C6E|nr:EAL domain-containing protein [Motiliproteus sediminis]
MLKWRLGFKFILIVVLILSVTLGLNMSLMLRNQQQLLEDELIERGRVLGHFISLISPEAILSFDFLRLNEYAREVTQQRDVVYGILVDPQGRAMTSYVNLEDALIRPLVPAEEQHPNLGVLLRQLDSRPELITMSFPVVHDGQPLAHLMVGLSRSALTAQSRQQLLYQSLIYATVILVLSTGIYLVFRWNVLFPVRRLMNASQEVSRGDFVQLDVRTKDELGALTETFNAMVRDIREERAKLHHQANYDVLTDLPNRMMATERLSYKISRARRDGEQLAVLFIDLDDFKVVNDTMGHAVGDELLIALGERFKSRLREVDTIARLGGDEFLVLLPEPGTEEEVKQVATRLTETVAEPVRLLGRDVSVQCSVGIAIFPDDGDNAETLMANADNAMYQAKALPRSSVCFYTPEMNRRVQERLQMEQDLNQALERGQFHLNFQPLVEARGGAHLGAEVLLRWKHPEKGFISPADFIPVAETTGQIIAIGDWVLERAAAFWSELQRSGIEPGFLAVNVSRVQFGNAISKRVAEVVADYRLPPGSLELELTESVLLDDVELVKSELRQLRMMGVKLALDDFGTGYSSLSYLKRFRFDQLKIDRSFVSGLPHDADSASLVNAIVAMAHGLDLQVVAEGVETVGQLEQIGRLGCDLAQGFLIARPMDGASYRSYLRQRDQRAAFSPREQDGNRRS